MRSRTRTKQDIWICTVKEEKDGIDNVKKYSAPIKYRFSVSATSGLPLNSAAGITLSYDRYITVYDRDIKFKEGTMVFVDVIPETDAEGNLVIGNDGITPITSPDYMIKTVLDTQKGTVARYGIKKV